MSDQLGQPASDPQQQMAPRSRRKFLLPSRAKIARNMAIFKKVEIEGLTHEEAADYFHVDRSRVSRIVKRLRLDLAQASPSDPQVQDRLARQRLDRELEKLRLEYALGAAVGAIRQHTPHLVTMRQGSYNTGEQSQQWSETIRRGVPPNMQAIKTFVRVTRDLGELNRREIADNAFDARLSPIPFFQSIISALSDWSKYVGDKPNPPNDAFLANVHAFRHDLNYFVQNLLHGVPAAHAWPQPAFEEWRRKVTEEMEADQDECLEEHADNDCHQRADDCHQTAREEHQTRTIAPPISDGATDDSHRS